MIILDTSLWIDHLKAGDERVTFLLKCRQVLIHPFVIGELALGSMPQYDLTIRSLSELPQAKLAGNSEVLLLIKQHSLMATGIGYVDAHLLASARLSGARLFTRDKRLARIAMRLDVGAEP